MMDLFLWGVLVNRPRPAPSEYEEHQQHRQEHGDAHNRKNFD
jgi:hypothetical protein